MKFIDSNHQANIIHQYIEEQLHHSYLKEYIDHPYIDRDLIYFLLLPFVHEEQGLNKKAVQWISTAMLLQVALDTHEKVTISQVDSLKERQLTVLAGVYFSSLYYKILADTDDVDLIATLAKAIKQINESKISIYKKEHKNLEGLLDSLKTREAAIVSNFFEFFKEEKWVELVKEALLYKKLVQERTALENSIPTTFINALFTQTINSTSTMKKEDNEKILATINELIENSQKKIHNHLENKEPLSPYFKKLILELLPYDEPHQLTKLYAEEG